MPDIYNLDIVIFGPNQQISDELLCLLSGLLEGKDIGIVGPNVGISGVLQDFLSFPVRPTCTDF